jgi:hypothetical protein
MTYISEPKIYSGANSGAERIGGIGHHLPGGLMIPLSSLIPLDSLIQIGFELEQ